MAPGIYGADIDQLRTLSRSLAKSGSSLKNIRVLEDGGLKLAAAPLDESGQLTVRDLEAGERPGSVVRALLSVPA